MSYLKLLPTSFTAATAILLISGSVLSANAENKLGTFSNAGELLKMSQTAQEGAVSGAITTIGTVASQIQPEIANCLDEWYPLEDDIRKKRRLQIIEVMKKFPDRSPSIIVFSVVEKVCGKFNRSS